MQLNLFEEDVPLRNEPEGYLYCRKCKEYHPDYMFLGLDKRNVYTGTASYCLDCRTEYQKTIRELREQYPYPHDKEICDCCGQPPIGSKLHLDHDHITKEFRGWLCRNCNTGIGNLGDDVEGLQRGIDYLNGNRFSSKTETNKT